MTDKVLLLDLETSPLLGWAWRQYDTDLIEVVKQSTILMVGYRWYHPEVSDDKVHIVDNSRGEKFLVKSLWRLLDEAKTVVAHNGDKFDLRVANSRFLAYRLKPPSPYRTVDTLKLARKHFRMSNRLDNLAQYLSLDRRKSSVDWGVWKRYMQGDKRARAQLAEYCRNDVLMLEAIFTKLSPWMSAHPSKDVYSVSAVCPNPACRSLRVQRRGIAMLKTKARQRYQCQDCGTWFKGEYVNATGE